MNKKHLQRPPVKFIIWSSVNLPHSAIMEFHCDFVNTDLQNHGKRESKKCTGTKLHVYIIFIDTAEMLAAVDKHFPRSFFFLLLHWGLAWSCLVTPTPWGFATPPASQPPGYLQQARACTPTWGWKASLVTKKRTQLLTVIYTEDVRWLTWQWGGGTWGYFRFWSQAWPSQTSLPCRTPG